MDFVYGSISYTTVYIRLKPKFPHAFLGTRTKMEQAAIAPRTGTGAGGRTSFYLLLFFTQTNDDTDRYNVCHNAHPTGHSTAKKRRGNGKYVDYYRGGARGDTFQSWAEAEYLLLPSF